MWIHKYNVQKERSNEMKWDLKEYEQLTAVQMTGKK